MLLSKFQINLYTHVFKKQQVNTHNPSSCGAGTAYPSEAPEFAPHVFVLITLVFCVLFYRPLFVIFLLALPLWYAFFYTHEAYSQN
jgi:hypothetical protein